jgi:hypothetical protein
MAQAYGKVHYTPDYDRGVIITELPDGRIVHRYADEGHWRDHLGNPIMEAVTVQVPAQFKD